MLAQATATALVSGGSVQSITPTDGGQGYQHPPTVILAAPQQPGGSQATADATIINGVVTAITIDDPGSGYTSAPLVTIVPPASVAQAVASFADGSINGLTITDPGSGYTFAPTITITGGGGSGAMATAVVTNGMVTGYDLTSSGLGIHLGPDHRFFRPGRHGHGNGHDRQFSDTVHHDRLGRVGLSGLDPPSGRDHRR